MTGCILVLLAGAAFLAASVFLLYHIKKQVSEMTEILKEVKMGNGNRRLLASPGELTAPLVYEINGIILSYEERILALNKAEETNRQLMTSLSHDVRTPLTTLIGYLDAVHRKIVNGEERETYMETARKKAHDLKEYIDILFDWFRLNSDEFAIERKNLEAAELTRDILIDWIPVFEDAGVDYGIQIPDRPARAALDPDCYRRILNNLIQNVFSHSHGDKIEIRMVQTDENISISVSDNGVGIESEDLKHIFERLYKCDTARSEKGSGLGLSIVRQLTEKMGGHICAQSKPGRGTRFTVTFSLAE